jgi:hypothetical protein
MEDSTYQAPPSPPGNKRTFLVAGIIVLLLAALGAGAWYILTEPGLGGDEDVLITPTPAAVQTPTPTPELVQKEDISFNVLNGTTTPGEAGFLQRQLEALGYENIEVGNASEQNHTATTFTYSRNIPQDVIDEILEKLEELYQSVDSVRSNTLPEGEIEITIGRRKTAGGNTPTPTVRSATNTPTTTPTPTP